MDPGHRRGAVHHPRRGRSSVVRRLATPRWSPTSIRAGPDPADVAVPETAQRPEQAPAPTSHCPRPRPFIRPRSADPRDSRDRRALESYFPGQSLCRRSTVAPAQRRTKPVGAGHAAASIMRAVGFLEPTVWRIDCPTGRELVPRRELRVGMGSTAALVGAMAPARRRCSGCCPASGPDRRRRERGGRARRHAPVHRVGARRDDRA